MSDQKRENPLIYRIGLGIFLLTGFLLVLAHSCLDLNSRDPRLPVRITLKNGKTVLTYTRAISGKIIKHVKKSFEKKRVKAESLTIYGKMDVKKPDLYSWKIAYSEPVALWISGRPVIRYADPDKTGEVLLAGGYHDFKLEIPMTFTRKVRLAIFWKHSALDEWEPVSQDIFLTPDRRTGSAEEAVRLQLKRKLTGIIQFHLIFVFLSLFLYLGLAMTRRHVFEAVLPNISSSLVKEGRFLRKIYSEQSCSIDFTIGFAALLVVIGHSRVGSDILPFGVFGSDLLIFGTGMNAYLFLKRNRNRRGISLYHLFFTLLLFFGGYTHIVIAHPGESRMLPGLLQLVALGILLVFPLIKMLKNPRVIGTLFLIPFLLHFGHTLFRLPFIDSNSIWSTFFFRGNGFPLFPWLGFFCYGIFILSQRKNTKLIIALLSLTGGGAIFLIAVVKNAVSRTNMSLSYAMLSLFLLTLMYFVFNRIHMVVPNFLRKNMTLVGGNILMFVYFHFLVLRYLIPRMPGFPPVAELILQGLAAYIFCIFFIFLYEKLKFDGNLIFPALIFLVFLLVSRYSDLFALHIDFNFIDILIGIVFAYIYIELSRIGALAMKPDLQVRG